MKLLVIVNVFIVFGLCQATASTSNFREGSHVVKKMVKRAASGIGSQFYFDLFVNLVAKDCERNGTPKNETETIQVDFEKVKTCLNQKVLFKTSKEEYLSNLEQCAHKLVKETTECLPEEHKFLPPLVLEIAKSVIAFIYDDFEILRKDMGPCAMEFQRFEVIQKYHSCVLDSTFDTLKTDIPDGKDAFCSAYISSSSCLPKIMKEFCKNSKNLKKFAKDYMDAVERPCGTENKAVAEE